MTPTKYLFTNTPAIGLRTPELRLDIPVKAANTVASTFLGVILANRTSTGRRLNAKLRVSVTALEKMIRVRSSMPHLMFNRKVKMIDMMHPKIFIYADLIKFCLASVC